MTRPDYAALLSGERRYADEAAAWSRDDLARLTNEMIDDVRRRIDGFVDGDVVFLPVDPEANDPGAPDDEREAGWTLGHVVAHTTAGGEEAAALALTLARGAPAEGRPRYETPWREIETVAQIVHRLEESRRMRLAMLQAWPDRPDLAQTITPIERFGPMNAVARYLLGLVHEDSHLPQIDDIVRQAWAANPR